ncbi:phosphoglycerate dehydrogenase [candidate division KSB1 bacterium]|nr:phosphoglycerate dehydrogenase [candidate division KSB1 bacterium]
MNIAITTTSFGKYDSSPLARLKGAQIHYILNPYGRKLTKEEVLDMSKGVDGIIAGTEPLGEQVLRKLPRLKVISRCGAGMDNVDLDAAERLGIKVFNTPYGPTLAVAELTVGLILDLLRKVTLMDSELRAGVWNKRMGNLLYGKKVGIIGFGRIGQKVAELVMTFGVEVGYCDVCEISCDLSCTAKEFENLLAWSDIITLHISAQKEMVLILGEKEIGMMKEGAWLVNVARGGIVDEEALYQTLKRNHLAGVALDVFGSEPYNGPLSTLNNVIITPHIGSYALEARVAMEMESVENIIVGLKGK